MKSILSYFLPLSFFLIIIAGFFVCKLKKLSNTIKASKGDGEIDDDSDSDDDGVPKAFMNGKMHMNGGAVRMEAATGKRKAKRKEQEEEEEEEGDECGKKSKEKEAPAPKKKKVSGIMKKALAELAAEREAAGKSQKGKKGEKKIEEGPKAKAKPTKQPAAVAATTAPGSGQKKKLRSANKGKR